MSTTNEDQRRRDSREEKQAMKMVFAKQKPPKKEAASCDTASSGELLSTTIEAADAQGILNYVERTTGGRWLPAPSPSESICIYRFRAEYMVDAISLLMMARCHVIRATFELGELPDVSAEIIVRGLTLEDMRGLCRTVKDGHVMLQTMQPFESYTGKRDYDLK